jgi:4-amino-4-deoxy-L-arabinose transferase-like glycosyltransferase
LTSWIIFGLAVGLRLSAALITGAFRHPELYESEDMARSLLAGRGLVYVSEGIPYYAYIAPLYPLLCAGLYALLPSVTAILIVQMVASAGHAVLVAAMGERLFNRTAGIIAGLLMAGHPGLIVYSSLKAHPLTVDALCVTLVAWQFLKLQADRTIRRSVWLGLTIGLGVLARATSAVFLPVGIAWLFATRARRHWATEVTRSLLIAGIALLVIAPWLIRNAHIYHRVVFVSTHWQVFWRGNNPHATGHSYIDPGRTVMSMLTPEQLGQLRTLNDDAQRDQWFRAQALGFIRSNPSAFFTLTLKKFGHFWWFAPQTGMLYPRLWLRGYQIFYAVVVCLALLCAQGFVRRATPEQRRAGALIGLFLLALSLLQSLYYVESRHRWALEPLVLLLAGAGTLQGYRAIATRWPSPRSIA